MLELKKIFVAAILVGTIDATAIAMDTNTPTSPAAVPAGSNQTVAPNSTTAQTAPSQPLFACPGIEDIVKSGTIWQTHDARWQSFTPSSASHLTSFIGAQWQGVKVGKIICLYSTDEVVPFPVSLEQVHTQLVLEPTGVNWSALVKQHRFCKSSSTADCAYYVEPPKDVTNVYKEIEYNPAQNNGNI